jgi:hypothetical protein
MVPYISVVDEMCLHGTCKNEAAIMPELRWATKKHEKVKNFYFFVHCSNKIVDSIS